MTRARSFLDSDGKSGGRSLSAGMCPRASRKARSKREASRLLRATTRSQPPATGWSSDTWKSAASRTRGCSTAFRTVPRHRFLPPDTRRQAYDDESIPIGEGQTITPPYDVAFMTEVLDPKPTDKVYEVGHRIGLPIGDPVPTGQGGLFGRDSCAALRTRDQGSQRAGLFQHPHPGWRRLRRLAGRRALRCDYRHVRSSKDPSAADRPAQGRGSHGDPPGRSVYPERPPGHQKRRQIDPDGAQTHAVRPHDRPRPAGGRRCQGRQGRRCPKK